MEDYSDRVKFFMSEERKQWHNPETILKNIGVVKGMTMADLGSGPGFFTIPMAKATGEKGQTANKGTRTNRSGTRLVCC